VDKRVSINASALREMTEGFRADGFFIFRNLIGRRQVKELLKEYDAMVRQYKTGPGILDPKTGGKKRLIYIDDPTRTYTHWKDHEYFHKARTVVETLLGGAVKHREDQIIVKPPRCSEESPWHQDAAYWKRLGIKITEGVVCWLALSSSSSEAGGLQFVAGSHKQELIEHKDVSGLWELPQAIEAVIGAAQPRRPVLEPGDATFHHYKTLHYSAGNVTGRPRKALTTHFWKI